jgi:hypothetical protein
MLRLLTLNASQNGFNARHSAGAGRLLPTRRFPATRFDLDHVGAEIGQDPPGHCRCRMTEFEDTNPGERAAFGLVVEGLQID